MNKTTDGGPAFPVAVGMNVGAVPDESKGPLLERLAGMSLRDYFAGQVLMGIYANPDFEVREGRRDEEVIARIAYRCADAVLAERGEQ